MQCGQESQARLTFSFLLGLDKRLRGWLTGFLQSAFRGHLLGRVFPANASFFISQPAVSPAIC